MIIQNNLLLEILFLIIRNIIFQVIPYFPKKFQVIIHYTKTIKVNYNNYKRINTNSNQMITKFA